VTSGVNTLERVGRALMMVSAWPGRAGSWLVLPMMLAVVLTIIGALLRLQVMFAWGFPIPLFGSDLSFAGLGELQWHLFAVLVMLTGAYSLVEDRHVRVDFIYARFGLRGKAAIDLAGDVVMLLPFCAVVGWLSLSFVDMAYRSGEHSDYGGLTDRYLVKAMLPIGLALLFSAGFGRILVNLSVLLRPRRGDGEDGEVL